MLSIELLQQRLKELQLSYDLLSEKIKLFRKHVVIESDISIKFKLEKELSQAESERDTIQQEIESVEKEVSMKIGENSKTSTLPSVLHNLPQPDYERFIGREAELKQIHHLLSPSHRSWVITIDGIGGIGKSALALEVAESYRHQYHELPKGERFDVIIWVTAKQTALTGEGIITRSQSLRMLEDIYTTIAVTLQREDITRAHTDEKDALIRQALTQQRTLLIVDNLETVDDERIMAFIREVPDPTKVIVTTRHRLDIAYPVRLVAMSEEDALQLIKNAAKLKGVTLTMDESHQLYRRTGGVPLAIVWSVAQINFGYSAEVVLKRLGESTGDIARFCFNAAVESIKTKPAYNLLLALSLFASDASRNALGQIANLSELDRDDGLVILEKLSLINKSNGRFQLLPLTKTFISFLLKENTDIENFLRLAFIGYFQDFCQKYGGRQWQLYLNLDSDLKNILLALEWAYQLKIWETVGDIITNIAEFLDKRGLWNELVEYAEIAVEAGRETNNKSLIMKHKGFGLGWAKAMRLRRLKEGLASILESKKIALELHDERHYAIALRSEAQIYLHSGEHHKAEQPLHDSLAIWRKLNDRLWEIKTLITIGTNERQKGNLDKSLASLKEALNKAEDLGEREQIALSLARLCEILWLKGEFEEARSNAAEASQIYEQLDIFYGNAISLLLLAKSEYALGKSSDAIEHADKAYTLLSKLHKPLKHDRSSDLFEASLDLFEALKESPEDPSAYLSKWGVKHE